MPTYEFRAPDGTIIERFFRMSEVPESIPLPDGSGVAVRIISGGGGLIFKGSGFYITDYGKDGKKDQRAPSGEGASGTSSDSGSKSDGKGGEAASPSSGAAAPDSAPKPAATKPAAEPKSTSPSSGASKPSSGE